MASEWKTAPLGEVADVIDSRHKTPQYTETGTPMVRVVDVKGGALNLAETKKVSPADYSDYSKGRDPEVGDLIISRVGSYGNIAYVSDARARFCLGQNTAVIVPKIHWRYLYFQLISPETKAQIEQSVVGAVQKTISLKNIKALEVPLPPLTEQKAIAHILGSLDDKIELNRRMNETLEGMAQALFKSWFVDFDPVIDNILARNMGLDPSSAPEPSPNLSQRERDGSSPSGRSGDEGSIFDGIPEPFVARAETRRRALAGSADVPVGLSKEKAGGPSEEKAGGDASAPGLASLPNPLFPSSFIETDEMGWIPEGWETGSFLDEINLLSGGTPKTSEPTYWNGDISWASAKDVSQCGKTFLIKTEKGITELGLKKSSTKVIPKFSTVVVARGATTGRMTMFGEDIAMNQTCYGMRMKSGNHFYGYCRSKSLIAALVNVAHGSVFDTITTKTFESSNVVLIPEALTSQFEKQATSLFQKILSNQRQGSELSKLRDTLLPKLISGELRIPQAEQMIKDEL